jgi:hypothetical protein
MLVSSLLPEYLSRMLQWRQMDFDFAAAQAVDLLLRPADTSKTTRMRKQIKNQWARDDPAFAILLGGLLLASTLAYAVAYAAWNPLHLARLLIGGILFEYIALGCVIATAVRLYVNAHMRIQRLHAVEQSVEWLYAFDVHCNALLCSFVLVAPTQYALLWLLPADGSSSSLLVTAVTNLLWLAGVSYYAYITFLGYSALPFVDRPERLLYPLAAAAGLALLLLLLNVNVGAFILDMYFGHDHHDLTASATTKPLRDQLDKAVAEQLGGR